MVKTIFITFVIIFGVLLSVAYLTYVERKVIAFTQRRIGPNTVGPFGLLQPIADAIKLMSKALSRPQFSHGVIFYAAPVFAFALHMTCWSLVPFGPTQVVCDLDLGLMYIMATIALNIYAIVLAGWASNSKYGMLSSLRCVAKMISYEVSISFILLSLLERSGSLQLRQIVLSQAQCWNIITVFPLGVIFFIASLAETNRAPFDLVEAESELMGGFFVEYSSMAFGLFFLLEYASMLLFSVLFSLLFLGGWLSPLPSCWLLGVAPWVWLTLKCCFCLFLFILIRATLPRYRYDQLMTLGWKVFMPLTFIWFVGQSCVIFLQHH